jgi:hypothetical protein
MSYSGGGGAETYDETLNHLTKRARTTEVVAIEVARFEDYLQALMSRLYETVNAASQAGKYDGTFEIEVRIGMIGLKDKKVNER